MTETLTPETHLAIIMGRLHHLRTEGAAPPPQAGGTPAARLHLLVEADAPWLVGELRGALRELAAAERRIAALQDELGRAQAKIRNQAGALTTLQLAEGRRAVRGRRRA